MSFISISFAVFFGLSNLTRAKAKDLKKESAKLAEVLFKMETLLKKIAELQEAIKEQQRDLKRIEHKFYERDKEIVEMKNEIEHLKERLGIYEEACKDCRAKNDLK